MAKKDMASLLDSFESDTAKEHDAAVTAAKGKKDIMVMTNVKLH